MIAWRVSRAVLVLLAALFCCAVTLFGVRAAGVIDFRFNTALSILYCALPLLSLPVLLLAQAFRRVLPLLAALPIAHLAVYAALNWRTCSAAGYCGTVAAIVLITLRTAVMKQFFAAAICAVAAAAAKSCAFRPSGK